MPLASTNLPLMQLKPVDGSSVPYLTAGLEIESSVQSIAQQEGGKKDGRHQGFALRPRTTG
jgi:hypothetical protein